jgi:hypothetical protein
MNIAGVILLFVTMTALNVMCVLVGVRIGQKVERNELIELPKIPNPVEVVSGIREERIGRAEREKLEAVMSNIDAYDGTSLGQRDIPR